MVMVHFHKERYLKGTYNKLNPKKFRPYMIMRRINDNAYLIDLPKDLDTSLIFNAGDLYSHPPKTNEDKLDNDQYEKENNWTKHFPSKNIEKVECVTRH